MKGLKIISVSILLSNFACSPNESNGNHGHEHDDNSTHQHEQQESHKQEEFTVESDSSQKIVDTIQQRHDHGGENHSH